MNSPVLSTLAVRAAVAAGTTALAALAFAAPASVQAAAPAADAPPVPVCLSITVTDLLNTDDALCGGGKAAR